MNNDLKQVRRMDMKLAGLFLLVAAGFLIGQPVQADTSTMTTVTDAGAGVEKTLSVFDLNMHANNQQNDSQNHTMGGVLTDEALKASIDSSGSTSSLHYLRMPASMPEASVSEWVKVAQQVATADRMKTGRTQEIILTDATVATVQIGSSSIPRVDAVDVSSYQDWMTQADFTKLKRLGVSTVIVKVTEGSSYTNSAAKTQIAYAKAAGLKVDVYDYIRFTSASQAQAEARYTASAMEGLGLSKATLIFADIEENSVPAADLTNYWSALNAAGYRNHGVYTGGGYAESATAIASVGSAKTWYAQYPDTPSASSLWDTSYGAWQFSSSAQIPGGSTSGMVDVSHDYQGLLKGSSTVAAQGPWIADNQYVTVTHTGYPLYSDFNWTVKQPISNVYHKTYHATGQYHHQNGSTYLSLYDNGGRWQGYINVKGVDVSGGQQGVHFADDRYVTFTHSGYPLYSSFAWDVRHSGSSVYQNTYHSTGIYHHFNGATYLSLYNGIGAWMGYVNANAVSVASGQQGLWQAKSGYLMANSSADTIWSSFNFTKGVKTTKGKYLRVNGMYHHANGSVYYSVYDPNTGAWKGYLNAKAGSFQTTAAGPKQPDNRYVTVTHTGYPLYSSWNWAIIHTGSSVYHQTFHSTGIYHHINGGTYLSLYDVNGIWAGWINANAVEVGSGQQGPWFADNRRVKVTHVGYPLYSNWNWSVRHTGSSVYGRTFKSTGKYYHFNGSTYLSLYDNSGAWYGYMNANGVEVVR